MKNKIYALVLWLVVLFWFVWVSQAAYTITWDDLKQFNSHKTIVSDSSDYNLRSYYTQFAKWYDILKANDRLWTISKELRDYAYSLLTSRKQVAKQKGLSLKEEFIEANKDNIVIEEEFPIDKCTWWYNTIDNISFANDFPTALTLAVWYRESTCAYYLPSNWDGPFQIVNKDYWSWDITEDVFKQAIQDFIDFAKNKITRYNDRADDEYPEINLSYTWFDFTGVVNFAALYNWWTRTWWAVVPNAPEYVYDGYWEEYSWATRFWLMPAFIKALEWEVDNL